MRGIFTRDEIGVSLDLFPRKNSNENEKKRMRYKSHVYNTKRLSKENESNKMKICNRTSNQFSVVTKNSSVAFNYTLFFISEVEWPNNCFVSINGANEQTRLN